MTAAKLLDMARAQGIMIATAESCTGGLIAGAITDVPGSSAIFDRGFVTYTNDAKRAMLGVSAETLEKFGAVSEDVAGEMARGAHRHSNATLAISTTGIAGPGGSEFKPEGRVCFGISDGASTRTETVEFGALGREAVRHAAVDHAIALLIRALTEKAS